MISLKIGIEATAKKIFINKAHSKL